MASDFNPYTAPKSELTADPTRHAEAVVHDAFRMGMMTGASIVIFAVCIVTHWF